MDLKRLRANITLIVENIWLFAESYEAKSIRKKIDEIMDYIKEEAK